MKRNVGLIDKVVRIIIAVIIGVLYFTNQITGFAALILGLISVVFIITSLVSICPLYTLLRISTAKKT